MPSEGFLDRPVPQAGPGLVRWLLRPHRKARRHPMAVMAGGMIRFRPMAALPSGGRPI